MGQSGFGKKSIDLHDCTLTLATIMSHLDGCSSLLPLLPSPSPSPVRPHAAAAVNFLEGKADPGALRGKALHWLTPGQG